MERKKCPNAMLCVIIAVFAVGGSLVLSVPVSVLLAFLGCLTPPELYVSMDSPFMITSCLGICFIFAGGLLISIKYRQKLKKWSAFITIAALAEIILALGVMILKALKIL